MNTFPDIKVDGDFSNSTNGISTDKTILLQEDHRKMVIPPISDKAISTVWYGRSPVCGSTFVTMHEFFGKPEFMRNYSIPDEQLKLELGYLEKIMGEKRVFIRTFTEVAPKELYRFITQELFNMLTSGMFFGENLELVYEEFHSNDEYIIRKEASSFFKNLLEPDWGKPSIKPWKQTVDNYKSLKAWLENYSDFDKVDIQMNKIEFSERSAILSFTASFIAIHSDLFFVTQYNGEGTCHFHKTNDHWLLRTVKLPEIGK